MNDHEAERIAAAMNALRPDWPVKSLRTLLSKPELTSRPRRDVTVALAWVACEAATATPARVLESGPWWRAAAVEGQAQTREPYDRATFCGICSEPRDRCDRKWDDHEFVPAAKLRAETTRPAETTHAAVAALKADIAPARHAPTRGPSAPSHAPRGETTEEEA